VTLPSPYSDPSSPVTTVGTTAGTPARQFTEPLREMCALALLGGNAVFLFLGFTGLFFVIDRWASDFGLRCAAVFSTFVGPLALGLPMAAMLLATHVAPMVPRSRIILLTALIEYGVSAFFGAVTFLGAFASDLVSVRATLEGLLGRSVWLGFLIVASIVVVRAWMGLFPAPKPKRVAYAGGYAQPAYGRPYPGQPMYPHATYQPGSAAPTYPASDEPTSETGWPLVPPPPMPGPLAVDADPTIRVAPMTIEIAGDATQAIPQATGPASPPAPAPTTAAAPAQAPVPVHVDSPTQQISGSTSDRGA